MMQATFRLLGVPLIVFLLCHCNSSDNSKSSFQNEPMDKEVKDTTHNVEYLMGHFDPATHPLFSSIDSKYADREGLYMRSEAYDDFVKMWSAAKSDGISLQIRSAARNFDYQKGIWERKWTGKTILSDDVNASEIEDKNERALKILLYSSMPGTSRHHWGTDIDLNSFSNDWFTSGEGLAVYNWLLENAFSYGFCQVYTFKDNERPNGYEEEKWHWSYKPLSKPLTDLAQSDLKNEMIKGFLGSETAIAIDVVKNYVLGIHPTCRH